MAPDRLWRYDEAIARHVAEAGVHVTPTLQVGIDSMMRMKERYAQGIATPQEAQIVAETPNRDDDTIANARLLHELGVPLVAGNDAGWRYTGFDTFHRELQHLAAVGLTPLEAIVAATCRAAVACQLADQVGTIAPGRVADLIAVGRDPLADLGALAHPALVLQGGNVVVDRR